MMTAETHCDPGCGRSFLIYDLSCKDDTQFILNEMKMCMTNALKRLEGKYKQQLKQLLEGVV